MWGVRQGVAAAPAFAAVARGRAVVTHGTEAAAATGWRRRQTCACSGVEGGLFLPGCSRCRALHYSAPLCGSRNMLRKLFYKKKKKFWYDSPTVGPHLIHKPSSLNSILKTAPTKVRKEDSIRKRTLDVLLYKTVRDILATCEAGEELYNLNIELSKGSLAQDFSACRIYWKTTGNIEQDDHIDKVLQQSAGRIRHILIKNQVLGTVPPIVFVRDKADAIVQEVERLLAVADFGPAEEESELDENDFSEQGSGSLDPPDSPILSNLFGVDHEDLNKQILQYKNMRKDEVIEGIGLLQQQQEQLAEIQKQKKLRKKKARKASDDLTPPKYLADKYNEDYWDSESELEESELEYQLQEIEDELETRK